MPDSGEVGFFSRARWGLGSLLTALLIAIAGAAVLVLGGFRAMSLAAAALIFLMLLIYVLVKGAERIVPPESQPLSFLGPTSHGRRGRGSGGQQQAH